jgi:hypothetical protein
MTAILQAARRNGRVKTAFNRSFTDICLRVTSESALQQLSFYDLDTLYDSWLEGTGQVNSSDNSRAAQISKLKVFWKFGRRFGPAGVTFVQTWYDKTMPNVSFNMLPTELRRRLQRGHI